MYRPPLCFLYDQALFLWIVSVINNSLEKGDDGLPFIGVLDIFGALPPSNGRLVPAVRGAVMGESFPCGFLWPSCFW